ncbi:MAG TPA: helix-turn-helix domain-containing protein [Draconibacterium sp.]|nr:helix-turn-helix domain-containing protein [Draconibacterium sp.]
MVKLIALLSPMYVTLFWGISLFFQKKSGNKANLTLSFFMFTAFLLYFSHLLYFIEQYELYSFFESIYIVALLSLYPLFYFYLRSLSSARFENKYNYIHFLPALILSSIALVLNLFLSPADRISYVKYLLIEKNLKHFALHSVEGYKALVFLISRTIFIGHTIFYLILGIRLADQHNKRIIQFYSNVEGRSMEWIKTLSIIYLIASMVAIFFSLVGRSYFAQNSFMLIIPSVIFSSLYFILGLNGSQHVSVSEDIVENPGEYVEFDEIDSTQDKILRKKLLRIFEKERIYIHPDLRITTIAELLRTNRTYISRLINDDFGMNFNEFVNKYRIEEAERLLNCEDNHQYTLQYIAEKSGFGNANSFTRSFKEINGITPGQYRLNCQKNKTM